MTDIHTPDEHIAVADLEGMVDVTLALVEVAAETTAVTRVSSRGARLVTQCHLASPAMSRRHADRRREGDQAAGVPGRAHTRRRARARRAATRWSSRRERESGARSRTRRTSSRRAIASVEDVWGTADLLLKVKEPIAVEYPRLREGLTLFTYLHIAADEPLTRALVDSGITAIAYETVETDRGALPLLAPMSEIAGRLAPQAGADHLEKPKGGRGILLGGVAGVAPARVLVIGGGMVGYNAAVIALGMGAQVTILERSVDRMRYLEQILSGRVQLLMSSALQLEEAIKDADLTIGAVLIPGARAPKLITREMLGDDEGGLGLRRRRDRPGRLRRDLEGDDPRRAGVHGRRRHPLLRREHARRGADHLDAGAHERDAALRRAARRSRATRAVTANPELARGVNTFAGSSRTRPSPRRTAWSTRRSTTRSPPASPA